MFIEKFLLVWGYYSCFLNGWLYLFYYCEDWGFLVFSRFFFFNNYKLELILVIYDNFEFV